MTKFLLVPKTKGVDKLKLQGHLDLAACPINIVENREALLLLLTTGGTEISIISHGLG